MLENKFISSKKIFDTFPSNHSLQKTPVSDQFWEQKVLPAGQLTTNGIIVLDSLEEIELSSQRVKEGEGHLLLLLLCETVPRTVVVHATDKTP